MENKPKIVCAGILNIKGEEIRFLADEVVKAGGSATILDLSLGGEADWADIPLSEVLKTTGVKKEDVFAVDRSSAIELVGKAGALKIMELYEKGEVDGIIAWAGSIGTTVATMVMRALPIGVPKVMMSTLAAGDVSSWLGNKDIYIVNPISEKGINRVTRKLAVNAARAVTAMGVVGDVTVESDAKIVALTAYGTTTPTVIKCEEHMEAKGWQSMIIHQVGTGATMEDLIRAGHIEAVFDITIGELSNNMYKSIYGIPDTWIGERLTAASDMGIPQIVCPGGLAQSAYGPLASLPQQWLDDFKSGARVSYQNSGEPFIHNSAVTIMTPTLEETVTLAEEIIAKLNKTTGPTVFMVPMRGWSAYDQSAGTATTERGWAKEKGNAPLWMPDDENKEWSKRATTMCRVIKEKIDENNPNLDFIMADMHILDQSFVNLMINCMDDILAGRWQKGMYRDVEGIIG
jgi:uncharacterized protein (UPF0261 family)